MFAEVPTFCYYRRLQYLRSPQGTRDEKQEACLPSVSRYDILSCTCVKTSRGKFEQRATLEDAIEKVFGDTITPTDLGQVW